MDALIGTILAILGFVGGIVSTIFWFGFRSGKQKLSHDTLTNQVKGLEEEMQTVLTRVSGMDQTLALQEQRLARVEDDHSKMINLVERLDNSINANNLMLAELRGSMVSINRVMDQVLKRKL